MIFYVQSETHLRFIPIQNFISDIGARPHKPPGVVDPATCDVKEHVWTFGASAEELACESLRKRVRGI